MGTVDHQAKWEPESGSKTPRWQPVDAIDCMSDAKMLFPNNRDSSKVIG